MMRGLIVAAVATAVAVPAAPAAADTTPSGPATLSIGYSAPIACPAFSGGPAVLVGWQADVGDGGKGGTVRPVFNGVVGDPVELPAQAGSYRFPAPRLSRDVNTCGDTVGLVQVTGEHAIVLRDAPAYQHVNVVREGQPDEHLDGARLALSQLVEPDRDKDLLGDATEDRTDLRVSANAAREADGRARIEVTVTNAGPLAADQPSLEASALAGARWEGACSPIWRYPACITPALAPGETRVFVLRGDLPGAVAGTVALKAEGVDLAAADNTSAVSLPAAPAFDLVAASAQKLSRGIKVQVRAVRAGRTRVTAAFKVRGRTVKVGRIVTLTAYAQRTVTIRPTGAKRRSLRRAAEAGALEAELTARTFSGKTPVTAKLTVTR